MPPFFDRAPTLGFLVGLAVTALAVAWIGRHLARAGEERLRSENRFRTIFEQAPMGIALIDSPTGRIWEVNAKYAEIVGRSREALAGLAWMDITHPGDVQEDLDQMARLNAGEIEGFRMDKRLLRPDGSVVWIRMTIARVQVERTRHGCHLAMFEDITGHRQAREERQRLEGRLAEAHRMDSLGRLAGGVAHDMNNVLCAILGLASSTLVTQAADAPTRQALETIVKAAERGGRTVQGLLGFARRAPTEVRELDLNETLREQARLLEGTTLARIRLELDLVDDLRPIQGDAAALAHAFLNLGVNALDAMPEQGTLTFRTRNVGPDRVEVQVEDTGIGMPAEVLDRCLEPFYTTKAVGKGTGLGLSLVYSTVQAHQGDLAIRSRPGRGTCVCMRFPSTRPGPGEDLLQPSGDVSCPPTALRPTPCP